MFFYKLTAISGNLNQTHISEQGRENYSFIPDKEYALKAFFVEMISAVCMFVCLLVTETRLVDQANLPFIHSFVCETGSLQVALAGLELDMLNQANLKLTETPLPLPPKAGTKCVYCHTWLGQIELSVFLP